MCDQMHLHSVNDTDVISLVIHVLKYDKEMNLHGLYNGINHLNML